MLRYDRQTKPGLVALYDTWPGNGAGPFLQPRSPQGARNIIILYALAVDSERVWCRALIDLMCNYPV